MKLTSITKAFCTGSLFLAVLSTPYSAQAMSFQTSFFNPQTTEQHIAYLYGLIAELQAQLNSASVSGSSNSSYSYIGVARPENGNSRNSSDLDVETLSATDIEEDEAVLRGRVDLDGEDEAEVWFEYGEDDDDLDDRTSKRRVTDSRSDVHTFTVRLDDLDEDTRYYYRAVAEDENGDRDYGRVRWFTTDDDRDSSNTRDDYRLRVDDTTIDEGDTIRVDWELPRADRSSQNWIGLFERNDDNRDYIKWRYLDNDTEGEEDFTIYDDGDYEFRLFLDNSYVDVATSRRVEVD